MKKRIFVLFTLLIFLFPLVVNAKKESNEDYLNIYLFYGAECPHCEEEMKYLNNLLDKTDYKDVKLHKYEVWHNSENKEKLSKVAELLNVEAKGVPYLVIGTNVLNGYSSDLKDEIKSLIDFYHHKTYQDPAGDYLLGINTKKYDYLHKDNNSNDYKVPVLGKINAKSTSLLLVSIIMGAVDGFNPCAMWILIFLLSLLISTKDRKKMWILGLTFIFTSGIIYLLFMLSWLNIAKHTTEIVFIRYLIGVFALIFGSINLYRFIKQMKEKNVGCDVTDNKDRKKIMQRIRKAIGENKLLLSIVGIILLAVSVNLVELLCSLGLPVMYTEILGLNNLSAFEYGFYMFIYILFFLIDDIIIFAIAMKTLKVKGISNKYMKYSHLIGGIIMLIIGILMLLKPSWLLFNF